VIRRVALLVGFVTGVCAVSAAAAREPVPVGSAAGAPFRVALAGPSAVWPTATGHYEPAEVHTAAPSRTRTTILRGERPDRDVEQLPFFDAGPRAVVVSLVDFLRTRRTARVVGDSLWAGPPYGPLRELDVLRRREWTPAVGVSGTRVALLAADRSDESVPPRLVVHDTRTGTIRSRRLPRYTGAPFAFAGRFVATAKQRGDRDLTQITVRKIGSWHRVSHVTIKEDAVDVELALRGDGTLAIVYGHLGLRAAVVEPGSRRANLSARPSLLAVAFGPRGVVYARRTQRGTRLVEARPGARTRPLTAPISDLVSFDADRSGRLALRTRQCVYSARAPALAAPRACPGAEG
jgi:hypothetical protein